MMSRYDLPPVNTRRSHRNERAGRPHPEGEYPRTPSRSTGDRMAHRQLLSCSTRCLERRAFRPVARIQPVIYGWIFVPSTSRNLASHAGCAGQAGALTSLPSTWAASSGDGFVCLGKMPYRLGHGLVQADVLRRAPARDDQGIVAFRLHLRERGIEGEVMTRLFAVGLVTLEVMDRRPDLFSGLLAGAHGVKGTPSFRALRLRTDPDSKCAMPVK